MRLSRPALPPASILGWKPINRNVRGGRSWQRNRCIGWGWVRTDHITPNWSVSKAHLTLLHNPESKEGSEWGTEEEEGSDSMGGGAVSHWAALPGFPSGEEGETNSYMGRQGACGGGSEVLGPAPTALGLSPSQPPFLFRLGLGGSWLCWGEAKPLAL